jgi:hypothetical protein
LTHEVENSGDGSASQQSEVQTVTFNAGRGLGGTATLTYNDLYGQSWTTRPFNVGGDNIYRLEVSISSAVTVGNDKQKIKFSYNGVTSAVLETHTETASPTYSVSTKSLTAGTIRNALLPLFGGHQAKPYVEKDRGNTIYVREHHSATSVKLGGTIHANTRLTYDIHIPIDMSGHDDNGALASALTVEWEATPAANTQELKLYQLGDRSAEIGSALTSLPNQVIPSVSVSKVGVTDTDTNSDGANGNAYSQSYAITFNNEANSGDQNMLTCNAGPCDEDGCINRGLGVSEVRYMHHDPENYGEGINFVNQGYFIMDIGTATVAATPTLSAGTIRIMWDTGADISSAEFAVVASAAEVQTALRTIPGWEGLTVELYGNYAQTRSASTGPTVAAITHLTTNHQFKVTFAAGYDDLGKSPTFKTLTSSDGAYATPAPSTILGRLYDQRFSNSIWLGKTTGYVQCVVSTNVGSFKFTSLGGSATALDLMPQNGDVWYVSDENYGTGNGASGGTAPHAGGAGPTFKTTHQDASDPDAIGVTFGDGNNFAYLYEGATSVQTSDYFAVGSTIDVLGTTWSDDALGTDVVAGSAAYTSNNAYRKFKVTGHVTNQFNREFAKLDSFPSDDGVTLTTALAARPDYNLKITNNNATVHTYKDHSASAATGLAVKITDQEVQLLVLGTGDTDQNDDSVYKLYYKGEESQNLDYASTREQIAEEINGFSALSGPVTVDAGNSNSKYTITYAAQDGDVAQLTAVTDSGKAVSIHTVANGWSIEAPIGFSLDSMQAGGLINITAQEVCTFTISGANDNGIYIFCYDGNCGGATVAGGSAHEAAIESILDNNGVKVLDVATSGTGPYEVTMPIGKSCDGLEMKNINGILVHNGADNQASALSQVTAIVKTVNKHNNGRQFRIARSFMQSEVISATLLAGAATGTCANNQCHTATAGVDSLLVSQGSGSTACGVIKPATDGDKYPIDRTLTSATGITGATATTLGFGGVVQGTDDAHTTECSYRLARHVITLDAMPSASATTTKKFLEYTSPVGSCSVSETTKGTYESYECSNRGACDGKSGLCTCYEGYSGQSCQTQTVLV